MKLEHCPKKALFTHLFTNKCKDLVQLLKMPSSLCSSSPLGPRDGGRGLSGVRQHCVLSLEDASGGQQDRPLHTGVQKDRPRRTATYQRRTVLGGGGQHQDHRILTVRYGARVGPIVAWSQICLCRLANSYGHYLAWSQICLCRLANSYCHCHATWQDGTSRSGTGLRLQCFHAASWV